MVIPNREFLFSDLFSNWWIYLLLVSLLVLIPVLAKMTYAAWMEKAYRDEDGNIPPEELERAKKEARGNTTGLVVTISILTVFAFTATALTNTVRAQDARTLQYLNDAYGVEITEERFMTAKKNPTELVPSQKTYKEEASSEKVTMGAQYLFKYTPPVTGTPGGASVNNGTFEVYKTDGAEYVLVTPEPATSTRN